jgi:zinc protease
VTPVAIEVPPPRAYEAWAVDDGTEALLVEDDRVPLVSITVRVPVGTWSERFRDADAERGWDLMAWDRDGALRSRADALGASLAVWSGPLECGARVQALASDADAAADLLRDLLHNDDYDVREVKRARRAARAGHHGQERDPRFLLRRAVDEAFWHADDPRGLATREPDRGTKDPKRLARARDRVLATPGRMVGFAGDLDRARAEALVARLELPPLGQGWTAPSFREPQAPEPGPIVVEAARATQVYFGWARPSMTLDDPRYPALLVASHALGGHYYSRLLVALRHEDGDTYSVGTSRGAGVAPDVFGITTFTRPANADALAERVEQELRRFADQGLTEEERAVAISSMRGGHLAELEHPEARLGQVLWSRVVGTSPDFSRDSVEAAAALSLDEINTFVAEFFRPEAFTRVRVVPD